MKRRGDTLQSHPSLSCILGEGKMHGLSGETVYQGLVDINLHVRLVLGENGKLGDGKSG